MEHRLRDRKVNGCEMGTLDQIAQEFMPHLIIAQVYIMLLTDIAWWKLYMNFGLVWLLHFHQLD